MMINNINGAATPQHPQMSRHWGFYKRSAFSYYRKSYAVGYLVWQTNRPARVFILDYFMAKFMPELDYTLEVILSSVVKCSKKPRFLTFQFGDFTFNEIGLKSIEINQVFMADDIKCLINLFVILSVKTVVVLFSEN